MRKYWKLISLTTLIGIIITIFYAQSAISSKTYPDFVIQKQAGSEEAIENMTLSGYYSDLHYIYHDVYIDQKGSNYFTENIYTRPEQEIKDLQKKYRYFMRAKNPEIESFIESDQSLIYTDTIHNHLGYTDQFHIAILNKETKESQSFYIDIPNNDQLAYIYLEKVKLINNELYVITQNDIEEEDETISQLHVYIFDIKDEELTGHEIIAEAKSGLNSFGYFDMLENAEAKEQDTIMFQLILQKFHDNEEQDETINQEIIAYNPATGDQQKIQLPEEIVKSNTLIEINGSTAYFINDNGKDMEIMSYDYEKKTTANVLKIKDLGNMDREHGYETKIHDDTLYIVNRFKDAKTNANILAIDLNNEELRYQGELAAKDMNELSDLYEIYLEDIIIK